MRDAGTNAQWIVCQIGAREHYALPRAIHQRGHLHELITDLWAPPRFRRSALRKLKDRFHPELATASVRSANLSFLRFEVFARATGLRDWNLITRRNRVFQDFVVNRCDKFDANLPQARVFAYSYAAKGVLKLAKQRSWPTVLGQIDAGPVEERIMSRLSEKSDHRFDWKPAPSAYWDDWREECDLADKVMVNSEWSKRALVDAGIDETKITTIPLAFEPPPESLSFVRTCPEHLNSKRPLRVLFLGQLKEQKGIGALFEAIKLLRGESVEFWFVGMPHVDIKDEIASNPQVKFFGPVPRSEVGRYYRDADVFIFPTYSDGFGLTQLEAQAWKLPVIASTHCGDVVTDGVNGLLLSEVKAEVIADAVRKLIQVPALLKQLSSNCHVDRKFGIGSLADSITNLF